MTTSDESKEAKRRTLAIRLDDDLHQQVSTVAKLMGVSVTDLIREAIEQHVSRVADGPELAARAETLLADIEREANERRQALQALLGSQPDPTSTRRPRASGTSKG